MMDPKKKTPKKQKKRSRTQQAKKPIAYWTDFDDHGNPRVSLETGVVLVATEIRCARPGDLHATVTAASWSTAETLHVDVLNVMNAKARGAFVKGCAER